MRRVQATERLSSPAAGSEDCSEARAKAEAVGGRVQRLVVLRLVASASHLIAKWVHLCFRCQHRKQSVCDTGEKWCVW